MFKNLRPISFILCLISLIVITSCGKDDPKPSKVSLLIKAPWKFSKATANNTDVSAIIQACIKDNILTFSGGTGNNGTGKVNEGATKCNATDAQEVDFTWQYDESFNQLTITGTVTIFPGGNNVFKIDNVTESELVMSQNVAFAGTNQLVVVTFVH